MKTHWPHLILLLAALLLTLIACTGDSGETPPCTPPEGSNVDPCEPGTGRIDHSGGDGAPGFDEPHSIRFYLDGSGAASWASHMVLRGTYLADTIRCVSRTSYRTPAFTRMGTLPWLHVPCFADVQVGEYILGSGPSTLTVLAAHPVFPSTPHSYAEEMRSNVERILIEGGAQPRGLEVSPGGIGGREKVLFIGPSSDYSVEALRVISAWDLERRDDGTVYVIHPFYDYWIDKEGGGYRSQIEWTIPDFKTAVAGTNQQRVADNGGRAGKGDQYPMLLTSVEQLHSLYVETGAINHPDGPPETTFPPACGLAVPNQASNPGLRRDCMALLDGKDTLRGTGTLNWRVDTTIADWDGITTGGTPSRVTNLELEDEDLTGSIPAALGNLTGLTHLDLSGNALTGSIPAELGQLHNLEEVRLSGNSLVGCIPVGLKDVPTNDLSSLNLLYCSPPAPTGLTARATTANSVPLTWMAVSNATKYRVEYRESGAVVWLMEGNAITTTSRTVDELACGTAYELRLSAHGSGTTYAAAWSEPSETLTASTAACTPPVFGATAYSFNILENAAVEAAVGTVSATDDSGEAVTYAITAGNDARLVAIGEASGAITLAADISGQSGERLTLTVAVRDQTGSEGTVTVTVAITGTCDSGTAVPNPTSNPGLVADCKTLLELQNKLAARDVLLGTAALNWSVDTTIADWDGITTGGTPSRVTKLEVDDESLTESIPAELGSLTGLTHLDLSDNSLTGAIPAELGLLHNLEELRLSGNSLTGCIPVALQDVPTNDLDDLGLPDCAE